MVAKLVPWLLLLAFAIELALLLSGMAIGADSVLLILLIPLTALSSVLVDMIRAAFQGTLQFVWYGASWLAWCVAQFALGIAALLLLGTPWAVFFGMLGANCLTLSCLITVVWRMGGAATKEHGAAATQSEFEVQSLRSILPFCSALGTFVLLSNADILVAYLKLPATGLGVYAASAVLPKAIVTATQPVAQVILPLATTIKGDNLKVRQALLKAIGTTFVLAVLGAVALWVISPLACGGRFGIKFCDSRLFLILALSAVASSVIRTAVIADLLGGRLWRPHLPIVGVAVFAGGNLLGPTTEAGLASSYIVVSWLLLAALVAAKLLEWRRVGNTPSFKRMGKR
jgi:O-antigen/teichoic acid export membrane protein